MIQNPIELLKENGFEELTPQQTYDLQSDDYFYIYFGLGNIHYFKRKERDEEN